MLFNINSSTCNIFIYFTIKFSIKKQGVQNFPQQVHIVVRISVELAEI